MRQPVRLRGRRIVAAHERGMTAAEYALGTVAVVTGVGVLVALLAEPTAPVRIFWPLVRQLVDAVLRLFAAG